jgi:phosphoglycolate phosphatase-like HAD superfamily hydrolase
MLLCFDYDGVIADSFDALLAVCIEAQQQIGIGRSPNANDFRTIRNLTFDALGKMIGMPEEHCANYAGRVLQIQQESSQACFFPAMIHALQKLATQHIVTIVTNSQSSMIASALNQYALSSCISAIKGGELNTSKSERITDLRRVYQKSNDETYMIGDTLGDITAGKEAQVKTIATTWGFQDRSLLMQSSPDFLCDSVEELLAVVERESLKHGRWENN